MNGHALATGDEDGNLYILDTRQSLHLAADHSNESQHSANVRHFIPHNNAIFDVTWMKNDEAFMTSCGDKTIRITDSYTGFRIARLTGCGGSVKCARVCPGNENLIVGASRDGEICMYDLRIGGCGDGRFDRRDEVVVKPVIVVGNAHEKELVSFGSLRGGGGAFQRRRVVCPRKFTSVVGSVTSVAFSKTNDFMLFSSGAADGAVKLWDLRCVCKDGGKENKGRGFSEVSKVVPSVLRSGREYGIAQLDVDESGQRLLSSCTDSSIYVYDAMDIEKGPTKILRGHGQTSFYIKAKFSPCGDFVISGSSNSKAYIWDVNSSFDGVGIERKTLDPILELDGHCGGEVSGVDWCKSDVGKVASCGDDGRAKVWTVDRSSQALPPRCEKDNLGLSASWALRHPPNKARLCVTRKREVVCENKIEKGRSGKNEGLRKRKRTIVGDGGGGIDSLLPGKKRYRETDIRDFFFAASEDLDSENDLSGSR
eukprot:Plantae.Rhodophyta-Hildenbrandia_rubra.ctg5473.p1 GENE.Plantae.Rhodophyta-Hildenbrandia_rubra.ctg5473~~Plantae.Rhodophyta-Hildenbrandia_rubra.ctg5473.p1  ORF type:complete len:482 (-),score=107.01 Plantae.Rhodophyta-Hildenbrandia_rubra.ctg5473:104-1549(-)